MALVEDFESSYEGSDESSESEMLDKSLSVWRGWRNEDEPDFRPVPLDLHTAASIGQYDCVWAVIQRAETDLNRANVGGWTPLMYASYIGHDTIVSLLIDAQVQVNSKNKKGQTPLMLAASCGNSSVAYLLIQAGADLESRDKKGWTALFHATYSGHQIMVKFLLDNKANTTIKEPARDFTPFMEAAVEGHEIIVQEFLQQGVDIEARTAGGDTARSLALDKGHTKIVSLIDNHLLGNSFPLRSEPGLEQELSSSDENFPSPHRRSLRRNRTGPMIGEGPEAFARLMKEKHKKNNPDDNKGDHKGESSSSDELPVRKDSTGHRAADGHTRPFRYSPSLRSGGSPRASPSHSPLQRVSPAHSPGLNPASQPANQRHSPAHSPVQRVSPANSPDIKHGGGAKQQVRQPPRPPPGFEKIPKAGSVPAATISPTATNQQRQGSPAHAPAGDKQLPFTNVYQNPFGQLPQLGNLTPDSSLNSSFKSLKNLGHQIINNNDSMKLVTPPAAKPVSEPVAKPPPVKDPPNPPRPRDLESLLTELSLAKYYTVFEEQDVDLTVFLTLTDSDLKEVGIKLFGPRRKMTNAIARWHEKGSLGGGGVEEAYANMLESRVHELTVQLNKASESSESAAALLEQEKQVRAVMETAYMEHRMALTHVQHVAAENRQRCANITQLVNTLHQYQCELARRFGSESQFSRSTGHGQFAPLGGAFGGDNKPRMSKDEQDIHPHLQRMPTQMIIRKTQQLSEELTVHFNVVNKNTDRLLQGAYHVPQQQGNAPVSQAGAPNMAATGALLVPVTGGLQVAPGGSIQLAQQQLQRMQMTDQGFS